MRSYYLDTDLFGEIYGDAAPMIRAPVSQNMKLFADLVVRSLMDKKWQQSIIEKCMKLASKYTWKRSAEQHINAIQNHLKYRGNK